MEIAGSGGGRGVPAVAPWLLFRELRGFRPSDVLARSLHGGHGAEIAGGFARLPLR